MQQSSLYDCKVLKGDRRGDGESLVIGGSEGLWIGRQEHYVCFLTRNANMQVT